jgi:hypothetical protein
MKEFLVHGVFLFGRHMERLSTVLETIQKTKPKAVLTENQRDSLLKGVKTHLTSCEYLQLPASKCSCEEIISILEKNPHPPIGELPPLLVELNKRIEVELKAHTYFFVSRENAAYYQKPLAGWETTETAFPSTRYDIEEAGKCLALRRNTAAVFHLMRVHGAGITALGKSLNEPTLDASHNLTWDNILARCVKELGEKFSGKSPEWQTDKQFYAAVTANLLAVKDAWRNPNAHEVGNKYTDEETLDIYNASKTFMRQLAKKLKETD